MTRKSKRILSRILAVVLAVTLVPSNTWGTASVVRAENATEAFMEEDADVSTDDVQEPQEEAGKKETSEPSVVADDGKDSDSAPVDAEEIVEDDKKPEVKPEKKEAEKVSAETDNKGILKTEYVHNFTTDGTASRSIFTIAGDTGTTSGTYTDKDGNVLSFNTVLKTNSKGLVTVKAPTSGTLIVVKSTDDKTISIGGQTFSSDTNGVIETSIKVGDCEIKKGSGESKIFYIAFIPEGADKPQVKDLKANLTEDTEVKVGDTITLSCTPADATIYYTTDGTEPKNNNSKKTYSNGITVETTMVSDGGITIKAYASKPDEYADSDTVTFTYNVSTTPGENQLKSPTAKPDAGEVPKGTEVQLKSEDGVPIYYTKDGTIPSKDNGTLFAESNPIIINEETVIKAIAIDGVKSDSFVASFTYTIKKPTIKVNDDTFSKSVISEVALDGDITFTNGTEEVFDISLKAVENANSNNPVKTAAEGIKEEGGKILYYDFSLVNNKSTSDTVSIADDATGTLKIKMPYTIASDVNKRNNITVVNATGEIEPSKDSAGFVFDADSIGTYAIVINPAGAAGALKIIESEGYEEGAYAEWEAVDGAEGYMAYVAPAGGKYERIDDELIREYDKYWRVDTVGLAKGTYYIKIKAVVLGKDGDTETATVISSAETDPLRVTNYDRSGFAFSSKSPFKTGSGAYNDDGTLKKGAQVIYVTADTAKKVTAELHSGGSDKPTTLFTGLQTILDGKQKAATTDDIIDIRIIGCITKDDLDHISSSAEGLQIKGANGYQAMNITIEGIGEDAVVNGFGFLIRNCGNVELRNFGILNFMDDGVSMDTDNCNIWAHDLDIFYGSVGGDKDQAKGDGSIDVKAGSTYVTISYNHFWDSGKCSLCGMEDSTDKEFMVTYHHNWFDHSDSRHARVRRGTVHLYNNYYDGNAKYGVGAANASSIFVEANYFRNCNYPMIISTQASDKLGGNIMSSEPGGIIKAYNNAIVGAKNLVYQNSNNGTSAANSTSFDAYFVANRADTVPSTVKTLTGGTSYNNFDTSSSYDLGVKEENIDTPENVPTVVTAKAGRLNGGDLEWKFDNAIEDTNYSVISALKTKVTNYTTSVKKISCGIAKDITVIEDAGSNPPGGDLQTVNPPTASPAAGEVDKGTEITLSSSNSGDVKIYYTLNGLEPTAKSGTPYTTPIVINSETTIKAIAMVGTSVSSVATFKYTIPGGTTPTPPPTPGPSGDDDDKPARGTYTLDIKDEYDTTVPNAAENEGREENKGTKEFFTLLFLGKTSNGVAAGSAISEKSSELEFEGGYKSKRYFLTSGAAKTNQASVKIVTKDKTTVTVWWQPGGTSDLNLRQLTVLNSSGTAVYTSEYDSLSTEVGYVTSFELANAGTYYIGSAKSSINIYKIEVKYPENGGSEDDTIIDPPTATPDSGDIKKGASVTLNANGDIYYTMVTNETDSIVPEISDANKYTGSITITAEVGSTVIITAIAVVDGKSSKPRTFTYTVKADDDPDPIPTVKLSKPEASPAPDASKTYPVNTKIGLTSKDGGTIYYTLDNTDPQNANGEPSETSKPLAENEKITLSVAGTHTIRAFALKDGYLPSDTVTFTYEVSDNPTMIQLAEPTITPASKEVEKGDKVTVTITEAAGSPDGTDIYYTTDGTSPSKTNGQCYTEQISLTVNETTTVTAIAINDNAIASPTVSVTYTVKSTSSKVGLWVELKNKNKNYIYTGSAIKPDIVVGNYDNILVEGVDYTVAYKNNINASTDAAPNKKPQITVTGKGNLTGKATTTFEIKQ
ncbi:MAG: chitobiase/beta-hexosaminidase C-terminal domain-containing protein [Lachnospiraceae bacterium]|nr:chitobiase/beta-hexosaminidase C-terminal domain-containing protein [Lachnospiraceae bacterium]